MKHKGSDEIMITQTDVTDNLTAIKQADETQIKQR